MAVAGSDPRTLPPPADVEPSARPVVARPGGGLPNWVIAAGIVVAGLILFLILDARRRQLSAPATRVRTADLRSGAEPPPLYVPPVPEPAPTVIPPPPPPPPPPPAPPPQPRVVYVPAPPPPQPVAPPAPPPRASADPVLVLDTTTGEAVVPAGPTGEGGAGAVATANPGGGGATLGGRSRASVLRNRATTVPQGTLIPAVLETALDSTRPGPARALVTRDVRGFDGSKVLIPRGSRLIGDYKADLQPGQNRALVIWQRLVRPDGATIDLASPSADPLGRVGIKGKVNSHFLERFGSALLQSTLNLGVGVATSRIAGNNSSVLLALPNSAGSSTGSSLSDSQQFQRTLRVRQGVSVSVFVAKDLDFTAVETKR
ncbi:TrbI/VirB10 family protein [Sphingomonas sp.]|uniref:TrbI/VirB10 family protein n=1 Tax=Sphingomonas sp. TaxID=28214 RepID=UPI0025FD19C2|nr:TrbI/VirB10 family protein [Sphingomonas sp.]